MTAEVAAVISGALFWLIIATNVASNRFGYQTFGSLRAEADLNWIAAQPRSFAIGVTLILIEHVSIVLLAVALFVAFGQSSPISAATNCGRPGRFTVAASTRISPRISLRQRPRLCVTSSAV